MLVSRNGHGSTDFEQAALLYLLSKCPSKSKTDVVQDLIESESEKQKLAFKIGGTQTFESPLATVAKSLPGFTKIKPGFGSDADFFFIFKLKAIAASCQCRRSSAVSSEKDFLISSQEDASIQLRET
jgi:hypothetical protein